MTLNREETAKLFLMIKGNYPSYYKSMDAVTSKLTISMWESALSDIPAHVVFSVAQKYMLQNVFPPTIAEIREMVIKTTNPDALTSPEEAWEKVILAVKKYGYYQQPEAFRNFSEPIARAVKAIGWQNICKSENIGIERSNFMKMYNVMDQGNREEALLPKEIFDKLQKITHQKSLENGKNELSKM